MRATICERLERPYGRTHMPSARVEVMLLDFTEIGSGDEFELFVADLLRELGWAIVAAPGQGPDLGVDIIATSPADPSTAVTTRYVIQCKYTGSPRKAIGYHDLNTGPPLSDLLVGQGAQGYILATPTTVTQSVQTHFASLREKTGRPYLVWDRSVLASKVAAVRDPSFASRHFPRSAAFATHQPSAADDDPTLDWDDILSGLRVRTATYIDETIGKKYIPDLYVARTGVEQTVDAFLNAFSASGSFREQLALLEHDGKMTLARLHDALTHLAGSRVLKADETLPPGVRKQRRAKIVDFAHRLSKHAASSSALLPELEVLESAPRSALAKLEANRTKRQPEYADFSADMSRLAGATKLLIAHVETARRLTTSLQVQVDEAITESRTERWLSFGGSTAEAVQKAGKTLRTASVDLLGRLNPLWERVEALDKLRAEAQLLLRPAVAIVDRAGRGKTNMVCDLVSRRAQTDPTFFIAAKALPLAEDALTNHIESFLRPLWHTTGTGSLEQLAQAAFRNGRQVVIVVDGLNEMVDPLAFAPVLQNFLSRLRVPHIRVILTCREEYWSVFTPILPHISAILLRDLDLFTAEQRTEAVRRYFAHYRISVQCGAEALKSLQDPLLLRFFCESYDGQGDAKGARLTHIRLKPLFEEYRNRKYAQIAEQMREIRSPDAVAEYIRQIGRAILDAGTTSLSKTSLGTAVPATDLHKVGSLYSRLLDEDVILEQRLDAVGRQTVNFTYEAFLEYTLGTMLVLDYVTAGVSAPRFLQDWLRAHGSFPNIAGVLGFFTASVFEVDRAAFLQMLRWLGNAEAGTSSVYSLVIALDNISPEDFDLEILRSLIRIAFPRAPGASWRNDALRILLRAPVRHTALFQQAMKEEGLLTGGFVTLRNPLRFTDDEQILRAAKVWEHFGTGSSDAMYQAILLRMSTSEPLVRLKSRRITRWHHWFMDTQHGDELAKNRIQAEEVVQSWRQLYRRLRQMRGVGWDNRARAMSNFVGDVQRRLIRP
jgi:Holliday junction resolvase